MENRKGFQFQENHPFTKEVFQFSHETHFHVTPIYPCRYYVHRTIISISIQAP